MLSGDRMTDSEFFSKLVPECAQAAKIHRDRCERSGLAVVFVRGFATWAEQIACYETGRERTPTGWKTVEPSKIVTHALPDEDPHCRGAAYDIAPLFKDKLDWTRIDLFQAIAEFMPDGLSWSGTWHGRLKDYGHYELSNWRMLPVPTPPEAAP